MAVNPGVLKGISPREAKGSVIKGPVRIKMPVANVQQYPLRLGTGPNGSGAGKGGAFTDEALSGLKIQATLGMTDPARSGAADMFVCTDFAGAPIFSIPVAGGPSVYGDFLSARNGVFNLGLGLDGTSTPESLRLPSGNRLWSGDGVPGAIITGGIASVGDMYLNTLPTANDWWYTCTIGGTPGTWKILLLPSVSDQTLSNAPYGVASQESISRRLLNTDTIPLVGGTIYMTAIALPAGMSLSSFGWLSGSQAAVGPTHHWMMLCDNNQVMLCRSADLTTTVIGSDAQLGAPIVKAADGVTTIASYTTPYTGIYYLALCVTASTTVPNASGYAGLVSANGAALAPALSGASASTGQTSPPATAFTVGTIIPTGNNIYMAIR